MRRLVPLLLLTLAFTGCANRAFEEELLVIALAVDQEEEGVHLAVKAPAAQQTEADKGYLQLEIWGESFPQAITLLNASTPRRLNFSQVREILIGESAAREHLPALLEQIGAIPRMRGAAVPIVCRGSACETAEQLKPYMGLRLSRYTENTLTDSAGKGFTPNTTLAQALRDLGSGMSDPLFILSGVNDFSTPPESRSLSTLAGKLPRKSIDPIDLFGAAATDGQQVTGFLTGEEMALLHLLTGDGHTFSAPETGHALHLVARGPAQLAVREKPDGLSLEVRLLCHVNASPGVPVDIPALTQRFTSALESLLRRLQSLRCDALGFGSLAVRRFATIDAWEARQFRRQYEQASVAIYLTLRPSAP